MTPEYTPGEEAYNSLIDDQIEFKRQFTDTLNNFEKLREEIVELIEEGEENALITDDLHELKDILWKLGEEIIIIAD